MKLSFEDNEIDGLTFMIVTNEHLKEVAPKLMDGIRLQELQKDGHGQGADKVFIYKYILMFISIYRKIVLKCCSTSCHS